MIEEKDERSKGGIRGAVKEIDKVGPLASTRFSLFPVALIEGLISCLDDLYQIADSVLTESFQWSVAFSHQSTP